MCKISRDFQKYHSLIGMPKLKTKVPCFVFLLGLALFVCFGFFLVVVFFFLKKISPVSEVFIGIGTGSFHSL